jgi:TRAP-type C4-dicarboxylate transport system permease small subunit
MRALGRLLDLIIDTLAVLAGVIFAAITVVLTVNVAMRLLVRSNVYGMVDGIEMGLMAATFLGAPWVLKKNAHVSVDIMLIGLAPATRRHVDRMTALIGAALSLIFCWASVNALLIAWTRGSMMRGVLTMPEWIPLLAPAIGGALLAVEFLRRAARAPSAQRQQTGL